MVRFTFAPCQWSTMEGLTSEALWDRWAENAAWRDLSPTQQMRHRCDDKLLYLGTGYTSEKYDLVEEHANLHWEANWKMYFGFI